MKWNIGKNYKRNPQELLELGCNAEHEDDIFRRFSNVFNEFPKIQWKTRAIVKVAWTLSAVIKDILSVSRGNTSWLSQISWNAFITTVTWLLRRALLAASFSKITFMSGTVTEENVTIKTNYSNIDRKFNKNDTPRKYVQNKFIIKMTTLLSEIEFISDWVFVLFY